ncbi:EamA family transporter [Leucobacter iarius]|uniref:DMT family transporter n=1 Tax=Leucobacter iarius TaxID=333963 RepID=A0ABN2LQI1_9MICO
MPSVTDDTVAGAPLRRTAPAAASESRRSTLQAAGLIVTGALGVQFSAVLAYGLFDEVGVLGTSGARLLIAAVLLVLIFRPKLRGRSRREWGGIALYGVAMAAMNLFLYLAIARIPLGIATTIDFLGPCLVALIGSRRLRDGLLALLAFVGVALIAGLGGPLDPIGVLWAVAAGTCFGLYTLLASHVGKEGGGLPGMALSVCIGAIVTLPFSLPALPHIAPGSLGVLLLSAVLGTALAFTVDTLAGKVTSARIIGVLFACDPLVGTLLGALLLGQALTLPALAGIALVVLAGAGIVWFSGDRGSAPESAPAPGPVVERPGTA